MRRSLYRYTTTPKRDKIPPKKQKSVSAHSSVVYSSSRRRYNTVINASLTQNPAWKVGCQSCHISSSEPDNGPAKMTLRRQADGRSFLSRELVRKAAQLRRMSSSVLFLSRAFLLTAPVMIYTPQMLQVKITSIKAISTAPEDYGRHEPK